MVFPAFSGRRAKRTAAANEAPEEIPTNTPSVRASSRPHHKAVVAAAVALNADDFVNHISFVVARDEAGSDALYLVRSRLTTLEHGRV